MSEKIDLRVIKTKQKLVDAFTDMINTTSLSDISVFDLCRNANVRRATFYKHFKDKYDFLKYYVHLLEEEILKSTTPLKKNRDPIKYYTSYTSHIIKYLTLNEKIVHGLIDSDDFSKVLNVILAGTYNLLLRDLTEDLKRGVIVLPTEVETVARFINGGLGSIVVDWFFAKAYSEDELIERLRSIFEALLL